MSTKERADVNRQLAVFATYTMITFPQKKLVKKKLQQTLETVKEWKDIRVNKSVK